MSSQNCYTELGYLFFDEALFSKDPIFVEAGSFSGIAGNYLKDKGKMIIYEPGKINFAELENNINGVTLWNKGLSSFNGEIMFYDYESMPSASSFKKKKNITDEYPINVVNLETVFEENNISKIDLLILSCEGCELDVLPDVYKFDIKQIAVNISDRIYGEKVKLQLIAKIAKKYTIIEGTKKWKFYLLIKKCL